MNEGLRVRGRGSLSSGCYYSIADCLCTDLTQIARGVALPVGTETIKKTLEKLRPTMTRGKTSTTTAAPGSPPCQTTSTAASEVGPPGAPGVVSIAAAGLRFV